MEQASQDAAILMLHAFASVGATSFDVTWTNSEGEKLLFRKGRETPELVHSMPAMLDHALASRKNLIVRPNGPPAVFLQLDDLDADALRRIRPASFLSLETSPGNHQAWVAMAVAPSAGDFARRLRKGTGADPTASGATRVAGSLNYKSKYAPDFPRVAIGHVSPGLIVKPGELESMGMVAAAEPIRAVRAFSSRSPDRRKWPSYQRCLDGAPANSAGNGPDVSRADYTFALIASQWGWCVDDVAERLMEESTKAQENGPRYARLTAGRAAEAAKRQAGGSMTQTGS